MTDQLTIQTFVQGQWRDALLLTIENPQKVIVGACSTAYDGGYLVDFIDQLETRLEPAVSVNLPLAWDAHRDTGYPAFVYDIIPAGAAYRSLVKRFGGENTEGLDMLFYLFKRCTPSPIGHLRVKESVEHLKAGALEAFDQHEVVERTNEFLEYAYEAGAALGGATGAQGEAPKLLMVEDAQGKLYADAMLPDDQAQHHWLIKFARNKVTETDKAILRAEYQYYKAIAQLGLDTVPVARMQLCEAEKPSLWMPRFDRRVVNGRVERIAMESIYSVCNVKEQGQRMDHEAVLYALAKLWRQNGQGDEIEGLVFEYVRRDLLNKILGNSDNHGRNSAIFRTEGRFQLAPIYDLAPMVLDAEGVTRATKWDAERKGNPDWGQICVDLRELVAPDRLMTHLKTSAETFRALPGLLSELPEEVKASRNIPLNDLDKRLTEWGLR
ncbi:type II toxin-antitoxin system HipA family toxin (plasmid) [Pseudomonas sp. Leaf58]|uniref:type II toxin-antitoxin system HipA family toxin n=1 Tax=Pseudomonas sp. Leaf58 TaxID=1736226 RepID=UPI0006F8D4A1|nr:HipA domain-containing protein [Pseudomonas sp. Leaf58]AYG47988.1 type II toxin-antitoxin system HipA family toxin [Pseudomonas sp. Leaf58]KQN62452.1 toxin HipA [Pseudomonas sp. Leaf58]